MLYIKLIGRSTFNIITHRETAYQLISEALELINKVATPVRRVIFQPLPNFLEPLQIDFLVLFLTEVDFSWIPDSGRTHKINGRTSSMLSRLS